VKNKQTFFILCLALYLLLLTAGSAGATQTHGDPEGLYVHQISHIFFLFSMGLLVYWIRIRRLIENTGWRYIQYSAILFMVWTADAFFAHLLDENYTWVHVIRVDAWHIHIDASNPFIMVIYYLLKLDHVWCVPAMLFLLLGVKRLNIESRNESLSKPDIREPGK
jgi:hypothetical protein